MIGGVQPVSSLKLCNMVGSRYNIVAIPLAAGVLAPIGIVLSPAVGAVLMRLSTIIVAINAKMLKAS